MLQSIRGKLGSLPVMILLALLIVGFAIWGIGDVFRGGGVAAMADVGDTKISEQEFTTEFNRLLRAEQQENPTLTAAEAVKGGLDRQVLAFLVQQETIKQALTGFGITSTADQIGKAIQGQPAFQLAGKFSEQQYEAILAQNGMTRDRFQEMMRLDLARAQLLAGTTMGVRAPQKLAAAYTRLMQEQRVGTMVLVPLAAGGAVPPPTDAQLAAFYQGRLKAYQAPEYRAFRYAVVRADDLVSKVSVTKAEIDQYIADHPDEFGALETRTVEQVIVQDQAVAKQLVERVRGGESFAAAAKALADYSESDLAVGLRSRKALEEEFNAKAAEAVFATTSGAVTDPVQSDFGWHVFKVAAITPARTMAEAQARREAEQKVRTAKAGDALYDITGKIEDELAGGQKLADITRDQGIALTAVGPVSADGRTQAGASWSADPDAARIIGEVFKQGEGSDAAVVELTRDRFLLVETNAVVPAAPRPLDQIKARVIADYTAFEQRKRAEAIAKQLTDGGGDLVAAAKARKLPMQTGMSISRAQVMATGQQVPAAVGLFFTQAKGSRQYAPTPDGGFAVVEVNDIRPVTPQPGDPMAAQIRQTLDQAMVEETGQALQQALQAQLGTTVNEPLVRQVRARLSGTE